MIDTAYADNVIGCDLIKDSTRRAALRALEIARAAGRERPTPLDCDRAAKACGARTRTTAAMFGWLHSVRGAPSQWVDVQVADPNPDSHVVPPTGDGATPEVLASLLVFLTTGGTLRASIAIPTPTRRTAAEPDQR